MRSYLERHPRLAPARTLLDVHQRFTELEGGTLAAAVTLMAFLSIFPLMVIASAAVGFVAASTDVTAELIRGLGIPAGSDAASQVREIVTKAQHSRNAATVVGLGGLLWAGFGVVGALQHAFNAAWQVMGRGIKDKAIGMLWLAGAGVLFLVSFGVTAAARVLPGPLAVLSVAGGVGISFALWVWSARVLTNADVGWRAFVPGAVVGAIGLEILKLVGTIYVPRAAASASALYGSVGLVFALLAWLFVFGRLVVYTAVVDVVLYERHEGTDTVDIEVPSLSDTGAGTATRAGRVEAA